MLVALSQSGSGFGLCYMYDGRVFAAVAYAWSLARKIARQYHRCSLLLLLQSRFLGNTRPVRLPDRVVLTYL